MARMDMDYELDDFGGGKKPRVIVKKKGGLLGKLIALFLGIVIGIVGGLGGLVGAGYYIATQVKIKDATSTITGLSGFEIPLSDYLSDTYADQTLLGLIDSVAGVAAKIGEGKATLNDLNEISPFVGDFLENGSGIVAALSAFGIQTSAEELMSKYLVKTVETEEHDEQYLTDFLLIKINEIPFARLFETMGFAGNEIITTLCYGVEGVDYVITNGEYVMLGDSKALTLGDFLGARLTQRIDKLPLDSIMGTASDEIMCTLFYGAAHRYTKIDDTITMNQIFYTKDGEQFFDDNGDLLDLTSATAVPEQTDIYLLTFSNETQQLVQLGADDKYYAFTTDETPQPVLFPKTTIGDLKGDAQDLINGITLESALNITDQSHPILKSIAYDGERKRTIKDLREQSADLINDIQLSQIITPDPEDTIVMYLLYGKEGVHYSVDAGTGEITSLQKRVALYDGNVYNEYGELIENATANDTTSYTQDGTTYVLEEDERLGTIKVKVTEDGETTKKDATLYYVKDEYYTPTTIGDMQDAEMLSSLTGRLQLQDVMDVGDNTILKHLGKETIDDLPEAINALTLDDVFGDHFYYRTFNPATGTYTSYRENSNHQPIDEEGNLVEGVYMVDINNQPVDDGDGIITREEADKALTGTWKYLLMDRKEDGTFTIDHHHTLTEMHGMVDYMSNNVQTATVRELKLDGIVKNLDDDTLSKEIIGEVPTLSGMKEVKIKQNGVDVRVDNLDGDLTDTDYVSDLTVEQLTLYMGAMLDIVSEMT